MRFRELDVFKILRIFGDLFWNFLGVLWKFIRNSLEILSEFFGKLMEGIDLFVRILVFVKILGTSRRKEEILILRSVRGT